MLATVTAHVYRTIMFSCSHCASILAVIKNSINFILNNKNQVGEMAHYRTHIEVVWL